MELELIISNITNPTLLFFILGIVAAAVKSDLEIPPSSIKFISLYLLFAIGFKGGQELRHSELTPEILYSILFGLIASALVPLYTFFILKRKMTVSDSAAVAASYGSVSAVTFVTAVAFLDAQKIEFGGHMVAVMAFMESPAIIVGMILMMKYAKNSESSQKLGPIVKHSFTNSSVLMILGSLVIGFVADSKQAQGIEPFTTDLFKGFLAIFLLEMGMVTAKRFKAFKQYGAFPLGFSVLTPILNGVFVAILSGLFMSNIGDRLLFTILVASASYIAVPAAMRLAAPKADPGLYIPMALGVTFPINITIGLPLYFAIIKLTV